MSKYAFSLCQIGTAWDPQLAYLLRPALSAYEAQVTTGSSFGNDLFQQSVKNYIPKHYAFKVSQSRLFVGHYLLSKLTKICIASGISSAVQRQKLQCHVCPVSLSEERFGDHTIEQCRYQACREVYCRTLCRTCRFNLVYDCRQIRS